MHIEKQETLKQLYDYSENYCQTRKSFFIEDVEHFKWTYAAQTALGLILIKYLLDAKNISITLSYIELTSLGIYITLLSLMYINYFTLKHSLMHLIDNVTLHLRLVYLILSEELAGHGRISISPDRASALQELVSEGSNRTIHLPKMTEAFEAVKEPIDSICEILQKDNFDPNDAYLKPAAFFLGMYDPITGIKEVQNWSLMTVYIVNMNRTTKILSILTSIGFLLYLILLVLTFFYHTPLQQT